MSTRLGFPLWLCRIYVEQESTDMPLHSIHLWFVVYSLSLSPPSFFCYALEKYITLLSSCFVGDPYLDIS